MTTITIYDDTASKLEQKANEFDTSIAEIIDALMDFINDI